MKQMVGGPPVVWEVVRRMIAWTTFGGFVCGMLYGELTSVLLSLGTSTSGWLTDFFVGIFTGATIAAPIGGAVGILLGLPLGVIDGCILAAVSTIEPDRSSSSTPPNRLWREGGVLVIAGLGLLSGVIAVIATSSNFISSGMELWLLGPGVLAAGWTWWASNRIITEIDTLTSGTS
jgi:hypothetical protein